MFNNRSWTPRFGHQEIYLPLKIFSSPRHCLCVLFFEVCRIFEPGLRHYLFYLKHVNGRVLKSSFVKWRIRLRFKEGCGDYKCRYYGVIQK